MSDQIDSSRQTHPQPSVLLVDDDQDVLRSLSMLLELDTDYRVFAFESAKEAIELLSQRSVDLVISDYLMPEIDGLEFLGRVRKMHPDTARILLTGYADKRNAIKAINEVGLFQYVEKPWDNEQLRLVIRNAIANKTLSESLGEKIRDLDQMLRQRDSLAESQSVLKNELALARRLQQRTLPSTLPEVNGLSFAVKYLPALEIGGDFYDMMPLGEDRLAVLIADVTGHGIQAALSTTLLKLAFRNFESQDVAPGEILTKMNEALYKVLPDEIFVAAMVLVINPKTFQCLIVNGGVPYPMFLHGESDKVELVPAKGLVLGVVDVDAYEPGSQVELTLNQGDTIFAFTDGLTEVEDETEQRWGTESLCQLILQQSEKPLDELLSTLVDQARKHGREESHWDDITILGVKRSK